MSYSLNSDYLEFWVFSLGFGVSGRGFLSSLKWVIEGLKGETVIGVIQGDTRSLDYRSYWTVRERCSS